MGIGELKISEATNGFALSVWFLLLMNMKLNHTKQCKTCPWKLSATVADIPNYTRDRHENLANTIADETGNLSQINQPLRIMACHHSIDGNEYECIG